MSVRFVCFLDFSFLSVRVLRAPPGLTGPDQPPRGSLTWGQDPISAPLGLSALPSDTAAGPVSSSPQPCPTWPQAPLSQAHPQACSLAQPWPVPVQEDAGAWAGAALLALACRCLAAVGQALAARPYPTVPWGLHASGPMEATACAGLRC